MLFLSIFASGFEQVIGDAIRADSGQDVSVKHIDSGLVLYDYNGAAAILGGMPSVSNTFAVLKRFSSELSFERMAAHTQKMRHDLPGGIIERGMTYRVRFTKNNQFTSVAKHIRNRAEQNISRETGLTLNREQSDLEFWYIVRADGDCYYTLQLPQPKSPTVRRGELRPDFAILTARWAGVTDGMTVLDPFAGSGALPYAAEGVAQNLKLIVSDNDREMVDIIRERLPHAAGRVADARKLSHIADGSVSLVLTDPPWGIYDPSATDTIDGLYRAALAEFRRVLAPGGRVVMLLSRNHDLAPAAGDCGYAVGRTAGVLVNGKKATLWELT